MKLGVGRAGCPARSAAFALAVPLLLAALGSARPEQLWVCPPEAERALNPVLSTPEAVVKGQRLAHQSCAECHGESGLGDGPAAAGLNPRPANWHSRELQSQSDACLFWKLSTGRGNMPPAERMPETDRWSIIQFIRSLKNG